MRTIKNYIKFSLMVILGSLVLSCETAELDLLDDPNTIGPNEANPEALLNNVQLQFNGFLGGFNGLTMSYTRMTQLFGEYSVDPSGFDNPWRVAYAEIFQDVITLVPLAEAEGLDTHVGVAKILQAYTLVTLVDIFGDVPYSEANQAGGNISPKLDDGATLYGTALELLDEALQSLSNADAPGLEVDLYFGEGGNTRENWIKVANTLKLRVYLQSRLVNPNESRNGINTLLSSDNLINSAGDDFAFNYLTTVTPNDSRHPQFTGNYNGGSGQFMSNNFMNFLLQDDDPRLRYYIYRQSVNDPPNGDLPCLDLNLELCYLGDGYFGRDHGDGSFTTSGMFQRNSTWGAYPVGGRFDDDASQVTSFDDGGLGQGIKPIILSSSTNFMKAEAALTLGTSGNAATFLEAGMRASISKAISFGSLGSNSDSDFRPSTADIDTFVNGVVSEFNGANPNRKLDILMKQYMLALWGNGIDVYNNYRRTGLPSDIQSPQLPTGNFPRVLQYPSRVVNLNSNISQQPVSNQVFWDNNATNFID